jgi:hypothetical protein
LSLSGFSSSRIKSNAGLAPVLLPQPLGPIGSIQVFKNRSELGPSTITLSLKNEPAIEMTGKTIAAFAI